MFKFRARRKLKQVACTFPVFTSISTDLLAKNSEPPIKPAWKAFKTEKFIVCEFSDAKPPWLPLLKSDLVLNPWDPRKRIGAVQRHCHTGQTVISRADPQQTTTLLKNQLPNIPNVIFFSSTDRVTTTLPRVCIMERKSTPPRAPQVHPGEYDETTDRYLSQAQTHLDEAKRHQDEAERLFEHARLSARAYIDRIVERGEPRDGGQSLEERTEALAREAKRFSRQSAEARRRVRRAKAVLGLTVLVVVWAVWYMWR